MKQWKERQTMPKQYPLYFTVHVSIIGLAPIRQVTHMHIKSSNIKGRSLNVIKVIFDSIRNCS